MRSNYLAFLEDASDFIRAHDNVLPAWVFDESIYFEKMLAEVLLTSFVSLNNKAAYRYIIKKQYELLEKIEHFPNNLEEFAIFFESEYLKNNQERIDILDRYRKKLAINVHSTDLEIIPMSFIAIMLIYCGIISSKCDNYVMTFYEYNFPGFYNKVIALIKNKKAVLFDDNIIFFLTENEVAQLFVSCGGTVKINDVIRNMYIGTSRDDCKAIKPDSFKTLRAKYREK
jgi:hypothetical protein